MPPLILQEVPVHSPEIGYPWFRLSPITKLKKKEIPGGKMIALAEAPPQINRARFQS